MLGMSVVVVLCCVTSATYGYIISEPDYTRNDIQVDPVETSTKLGKGTKMELDHRVKDRIESGRGDSKDLLYPILIGVATKILSTIPVILTTLALGAGFSLAASKAALMFGGVLLFYHYLSEGGLVTSLPKHWRHLPDWSGLWAHTGYHPQLSGYHHSLGLGYHRDRNDRRWDVGPTRTGD